ncbi:hypothetical protein CLAFUW4_06719 [Fulvia fulva]|uniref:Uncharacterized protein n=1 Tax=Passalora fulva TaxID=5499 RepID=A0A9Q8PAM1_PASFU|nr:uncharacterized protein CLAFUR5_06861 [Fulvia fulva]KAK4621780.1 hypothetical protein CLAFUR4_06727 [Fulvia fulva]KAK4622604.1 hypothetical protein CLAFUR0_06721 [Fulvia fulva]UJO18978.1 hypothetical protein CLAFUR5_06861 [Fulvia fulva]WPV15906.1 hypothetical protein CLAFUW4_06719 [Fulvia fulva]WPV31208.1 hypothetical protein CLAFUW7_06718 [Fulvia fulva]
MPNTTPICFEDQSELNSYLLKHLLVFLIELIVSYLVGLMAIVIWTKKMRERKEATIVAPRKTS